MGAAKKMFDLLAVTTPRVELEFITQGQNVGGGAETTAGTTGSGSVYVSSTNQSFTVNWGDGVIDTLSLVAGVNFNLSGAVSGRHLYSSPYNYPVSKVIKVKFSNPLAITRFDAVSWWLRGNLSTAIDTLQNLVTLNLGNNNLDSIPPNIANLTALQNLNVNNSPSLAGVIPNFILGIASLKMLSFFNSMAGLNYTTSNYTRLNELPLLDDFTYGNGGHTDLNSAIFTAIPLLKNLTVNSPNGAGSITTTIPSNASGNTLWKTYNPVNCYRTVTLTDSFVDTLYTFISTNASKTGASSLPFRGFTLIMASGTAVPTGIYQQPTGYVAGVSNGSPASPQEELWLLVNQYAGVMSVASWSVSSITVGATTQVTLANINVGNATGQLQIGSVVHFKSIVGTVGASLNNLDHTITNISGNIITIGTNTTGLAYTSGGVMYKKTF